MKLNLKTLIASIVAINFVFWFGNANAQIGNPNDTKYYKLSTTEKEKNIRKIKVTSGTGFFVNRAVIVTNEHVVRQCEKIKVRGAIESSPASIIDIDKTKDLALLQAARTARDVAALRGDAEIKIGEEVNVMGYPLERGMSGDYLIRKATITNNLDIYNGVERIQFTDSVEKGNSGGPLLDTSGTVIGVIVGKMSFFNTGSDTLNTKPIATSSVAITLGTLKDFLSKNKIFYHTDNVNYKFSDSYMENKAKEYIVNVQCIKGVVN